MSRFDLSRGPGIAALLFLALAGVAPPASGEAVRTLRAGIPAQESARFAVENLAGTMRVVRGSGDAVSAVATIHAADETLAGQVRFERIASEGGVPTLRVRYPAGHRTLRYPHPGDSSEWGFLDFFSSSRHLYDGRSYTLKERHGRLLYADVVVEVPAHFDDATFRNVAGRLEAEDLDGRLTFAVASADVYLARLSGQVRLRGTSGDARVSQLAGTFESDLTSGDCELEGFQGETVSFHANSGDVRARDLKARRLEVHTTSGDARIAASDVEDFDGHANSGDIHLDLGQRLHRARIHTSSGDVRVTLSRDASFEATSDHGSGETRVDWIDAVPVTRNRRVTGYRRGTGGAQIEVETGSGDFVLAPR